jgi:hypothetical protein
MSDGAGASTKSDEREVSARERAALAAWAVNSPARVVAASRVVRRRNVFDSMFVVIARIW